MLAPLLASAAANGGVTPEDAAAAGREPGPRPTPPRSGCSVPKADARRCVDRAQSTSCASLGFDPATVDDGATATVAFTRCPFQDLADVYPDLVCHLHRGMVEGFVEVAGGAKVAAFHTLADRDPCRVTLALR